MAQTVGAHFDGENSMRSFSLSRWTLTLVVGVSLLSSRAVDAADSNRVNFDTSDGVKLQGYYYPSKEGRKGPAVLMLHNFNTRKGGTALDDGWDALAKALAEKGYAVLAFDFRGHGGSTTVTKEFWNFRHNQRVKGFTGNPAKLPTTIAFTDFQPSYYNYFVLDIVAARAYLDGQNDAGDLNVSQLIVIGAGEGATLGAMWMASEWHRHRATPPPGLAGLAPLARYTLDKDSEGIDQACAVWLSISPTLANNPKPVVSWLKKIGGTENKLPMVFIYGDKDESANKYAGNALTNIVPGYKRGPNTNKDFQFTGEKPIPDTKLSGSALLDPQLDTTKFIIESYVDPVVKRGQPQWRMRDYTKSAFIYLFGTQLVLGKVDSEKMPRPFPFTLMGVAVVE